MEYDIILVTAEPYVDHPFSGTGILKRVLEDKGFSVAVIATPNWRKDDDFKRFGEPRLFFGVTSGAIDSMLVNYTPMKRKRQENEFSRMSYLIPDRAVTVYCNAIRKLFKGSKIVLGGTESSLRRFSHYDYWDNDIRKSILFDTRADILVYGYGELQILEIAERLKEKKDLIGLDGTCILSKTIPDGFIEMPSFESVKEDKKKFCEMQNLLDTKKNLAQKSTDKYVLQYKMRNYSAKDLDYFYSLNYSRNIPDDYPEFKNFQFSIITHRGCFGNCNFCSIAVNGGKKIVSRSIDSILNEIRTIVKHPDFTGTIELSGASANMYGMDCRNSDTCNNECLKCANLDSSHSKMLELLRKARDIPEVKKIFVKSGLRYDLAIRSPEYVKEIIKYHTDEKIMIAPEHISGEVLSAMNKKNDVNEFIKLFYDICGKEKVECELSYYSMVAHPGCTLDNSLELQNFIKTHKFSDYVQVFTPTPMTVSTCMYYTGLDPKSGKEIYVPYTYNEKKQQKNLALNQKSNREKKDARWEKKSVVKEFEYD